MHFYSLTSRGTNYEPWLSENIWLPGLTRNNSVLINAGQHGGKHMWESDIIVQFSLIGCHDWRRLRGPHRVKVSEVNDASLDLLSRNDNLYECFTECLIVMLAGLLRFPLWHSDLTISYWLSRDQRDLTIHHLIILRPKHKCFRLCVALKGICVW